MKKLTLVLTAFFVVLGFCSYAQDANKNNTKKNNTSTTIKDGKKAILSGVVVDEASKEPLVGAVIIIDGTEKGAIADEQGKFTVKNLLVGEEVKLDFSYVGYKNKILPFKVTSENVALKDTIFMQSDLNIEVEVVARVTPVAMKGDTTVFNAAAYKTNPDATAGDLMAKMPGFEKNEDGTVTAQGEKITKVYIDGQSFFKNDLKAALETLPAGAVESIELFDEMSDRAKFTGFDDGNRSKVINIITKAKASSAKIIDISGGYGYDDIYMGKAMYTKFKETGNFSISVGANNASLPAVGYGRVFGRAGNGTSTQYGAQISYSKTFNKTDNISFHYSYNRNQNETNSKSYRTYFPTDDYEFRVYNSKNSNNNTANSHNFGFDIQKDLGRNKKTRITFRPTITASTNDSYSESWSESIIDGDSTTTDNKNYNSPVNISASGNLSIMQKFTENNFLTLSLNGSYSDNSTKGTLNGVTIYNKEDIDNNVVPQNQRSKNISNSNNIGANLEYTQRISRRSGLSLNYDFNSSRSNSNAKTYDILELVYDDFTETYEKLDSIKSNDFKRDNMTNDLGVRYNYMIEKFSFDLSAKYQNSFIKDDQLFPTVDLKNHSFNGALFNANLRYTFKNEKGNLNFGYRGSPSYPNISQLQNVLNNENPLQLSSGNPNLKQMFTNNVNLGYNWTHPIKGIYIGVRANVGNSINGVVSNTVLFDRDSTIDINGLIYDVRKGTQYTTYTNMDGKWKMSLNGSLSFPLDFIKSKLNLNFRYNYTKSPSMYNNQEFFSTNSNYGFTLGLHSNISENVDFTIRNNASYGVSRSERTGSSNNNSFTDNLSVRTNIIIWKGVFINADYSMRYTHYSNNKVESPFNNRLNAAAGVKMNGDTWEIRFSAYDILNQNKNVNQNVSDIYISETYSNVMGRYLSVSLSYRFNSFRQGMLKYLKNDKGRPGETRQGMRNGTHGSGVRMNAGHGGGGHGGYRGGNR